MFIKSTGIFIVNNKKLLLFLRDNNPKIKNPNRWCLVGGLVEKNETFDEAIKREIFEEISLDLDNFQKIGNIISFEREYHLYFLDISNEKREKIKLGDEGQKLQFFSFSKIDKLDLSEGLRNYFDSFSDGIKDLIEKKEINKTKLGFNKNDKLFK